MDNFLKICYNFLIKKKIDLYFVFQQNSFKDLKLYRTKKDIDSRKTKNKIRIKIVLEQFI